MSHRKLYQSTRSKKSGQFLAKFNLCLSCNSFHNFCQLHKWVRNKKRLKEKVSVLINNCYFSIPQEKWYIYPALLVLNIQKIIVPVIWFSAISTKILMKKEMKRYLFGNSIHKVHEQIDIHGSQFTGHRTWFFPKFRNPLP